jgi:hypothetical protein
MTWLTLLIGGIILVAGLIGQFFFLRRGHPAHPADRRMGRIVITIGSTVVGLWVLFFSLAHLMRLHSIGRW